VIDHPALYRILMNVISMMHEINLVANSVIGESPLLHLALSPNDAAEFMRVCAFNQLNGPLNGYVHSGSEQEMHMLGHQNKCVQFISALMAMPIQSFQKNADVRFNDEQSAALPRRESYEISSRRRDKSRRLQSKPQRLKAASASEHKSARVELVPFPVIFSCGIFFLGKANG
jgi:hypothetical protein